MKPATIPLICGISLTAMLSAGLSHWWSVREFSGIIAQWTPPAPAVAASPSTDQPSPQPALVPATAGQAPVADTNTVTSAAIAEMEPAHQKQFYEALIEKLARVENQNRELLDQLGETNRDLMKLEFRVDTHSASFRPMPISEETSFSTLDADSGVLPPRAIPAAIPITE